MQTPTRAFQALHEVAVAAAGLRDPTALAALVVDRARDLLEADAAALYWFLPETGMLRTLAHNDPLQESPEPPFNPGEGAAGRAFAEAAPVRIDEYRSWPDALPTSPTPGLASGLAVPLLVSPPPPSSPGFFTPRPRVCRPDRPARWRCPRPRDEQRLQRHWPRPAVVGRNARHRVNHQPPRDD